MRLEDLSFSQLSFNQINQPIEYEVQTAHLCTEKHTRTCSVPYLKKKKKCLPCLCPECFWFYNLWQFSTKLVLLSDAAHANDLCTHSLISHFLKVGRELQFPQRFHKTAYCHDPCMSEDLCHQAFYHVFFEMKLIGTRTRCARAGLPPFAQCPKRFAPIMLPVLSGHNKGLVHPSLCRALEATSPPGCFQNVSLGTWHCVPYWATYL